MSSTENDAKEDSLSAAFLFGNVDRDGQLAADEDWSLELRQASGILSEITRSMDVTESLLNNNATPTSSASARKHSATPGKDGPIQPAADAQDFGDIDEVAPLEDGSTDVQFTSAPLRPLHLKPLGVRFKGIPADSTGADDDGVEVVDDEKPVMTVESVFPGFRSDKILKFSELMAVTGARPRQEQAPPTTAAQRTAKKARVDRLVKTLSQSSQPAFDQRYLFLSDVPVPPSPPKSDLYSTLKVKVQQDGPSAVAVDGGKSVQDMHTRDEMDEKPVDAPEFHPINTTEWESQIVWEPDEEQKKTANSPNDEAKTQQLSIRGPYSVPNYEIEAGEWVDHIVWDESDVSKLATDTVIINLNDPNIYVDAPQESSRTNNQQRTATKSQKRRGRPGHVSTQQPALPTTGFMSRWPTEKFNISNDLYYEFYRRSGRVRQMFGRNQVQHSLPALRLQLPFFKRFMTKSDIRSLHRPHFKIAPNTTMKFTRTRNIKKKKIKGKEVSEVLTDVKHITLKDNASYLLFEFSEEYPPLMSNSGMGSLIVNFYRKRDERDPFVPKLPDGMPTILEQVDASPFFGFGDVFPGQTLQALKNNLLIAPIFKHESKSEDFLFIKHTYRRQTKYYVREIPRIYCVGQTLPLQEVQPPQSRKLKNYIRDRLKFASLRFIKRKGRNARYRLNKIINNYHQYHGQSMRKHLKNFCEFQKHKNQLMVKVFPHVPIPTEQELFKMVTPEMVCLFESMRTGQQRLADAGFGNSGGLASDDEEDDEIQVDDEISLAPWNVTKNVLLATQSKGMCRIYGPGDPTGRGEGFSFFRFSMKKMFIRSGASMEEVAAAKEARTKTGHKFAITEQQKVYKAEILRIWLAQLQSLSNPEEPTLTDEESYEDNTMEDMSDEELESDMGEATTMTIFEHGAGGLKTHSHLVDISADSSRAASPFMSARHLMRTNSEMGDDMTIDTQSVTSSRYAARSRGGMLITRVIKNEDGEQETSEEVITDPRVINAYKKQRNLLLLSETFKPEDDEETRKKKLVDELRRLKRMQVRKDLNARPTKRKCRACGAVGHIASNKVCPLFAQTFPDRVKKEKTPPPVVPEKAAPVKAADGKITIATSAIVKMEQKMKKERTLKLPAKMLSAVASPSKKHQPGERSSTQSSPSGKHE